jgi:hypothetical protein
MKTIKIRAVKRKTITTNDITKTEITEDFSAEVSVKSKPKRQRRKKETEPIMPLAPRVPGILKIGAHISAAKGIYNAIPNAVYIGYLYSLK